MNSGPGNLKIVNPMIAPIDDEGGLCKGLGGQFATIDIRSKDCTDVFTKPMVNMITPRSDIASPLDTIRTSRSHQRSPLTFGVGSGPSATRLFSAALALDATAVAAPLSRAAPPHLVGLRSSLRAFIRFAARVPTIASTHCL